MSNLKLLSKILRLQDMKITHFEFKNRDQELHLSIKPYPSGCRCPECGRPVCVRVRTGRRSRIVR